MANSTFANLKINALRKAGNNYASTDATRLTMAGNIINEVLSEIQNEIKGHPFTLDIGNTVSTTASQAYVALTDTDIIEILKVYQRTSDVALRQITYKDYIELQPDPTRWKGLPDVAYAPMQTLNGSGQNIWSLYLLPTPSSVITLYYDYVKNLRFANDDTTNDASFCPLPTTYDGWIYAEFKPKFYEIIDPKNRQLIDNAMKQAQEARRRYKQDIMSQVTRYDQVASRRGETLVRKFPNVERTF